MNGMTQVPNAVSTYFSRAMLTKAYPYLPHTLWAEIKDIPRNNTDKIRCRRYSLLTVSTDPIVEGVTPSLDQLTVTNVDATVQQYGRGFLITDKLLFTTQDPVLAEVADILGQSAANTADQLTRDALATTSTIQYASSATQNSEITPSMLLTRSEIKEAVRTLKNNNAEKITEMIDPSEGFDTSPVNACYVGLVHPNSVFDVKEIEGFIPVEKYGQKVAMPHEIGSVDEVRFVETTNAKVRSAVGAGSPAIDVYSTIILAKNAYAISRIDGEAMENIIEGPGGNADPLHQRQTSAWKMTFVAFITNDAFMLDLRHAVSA